MPNQASTARPAWGSLCVRPRPCPHLDSSNLSLLPHPGLNLYSRGIIEEMVMGV